MAGTLLLHGDVTGPHPCAIVNRHLSRGLAALGWNVMVAAAEGGAALPWREPPDVYIQHNSRYDWRAAPGQRNFFVPHAPLETLLAEQPHLRYRLNNYHEGVFTPEPVTRPAGLTIAVETLAWGTEVQPLAPAPTSRLLLIGPHGAALDAVLQMWPAGVDLVVVPTTVGPRQPGPWTWHDGPVTADLLATCRAGVVAGDDWGHLSALRCLGAGRPVLVSRAVPDLPDAWPYALETLAERIGQIASHRSPEAVAATVLGRTWEAVAIQLHERLSTMSNGRRGRSSAAVAYAFFDKGPVSWKKYSAHVDSCLGRSFDGYRSLGVRARFDTVVDRVLVSVSEFALEPFLLARRRNPQVRLMLHQEGSVLRRRDRIVGQERERCGLAPRVKPAFEYWRNDMELAMAERIVVSSQAARRQFIEAGLDDRKLRVLPLGIDVEPWQRPRRDRTRLRFMFVGTDPFRKGIRILLEAWDTLRPKGAELLCIGGGDILQSELLVRYLVRNPSIRLHPFVSPRRFVQLYREVDCQVLPSLEDTFSLVVAEGMGRGCPAIVSDETGVCDILAPGVDSLVVPTGSPQALVEALARVCDTPAMLDDMSAACYETACRHSWARFDENFAAVVRELA